MWSEITSDANHRSQECLVPASTFIRSPLKSTRRMLKIPPGMVWDSLAWVVVWAWGQARSAVAFPLHPPLPFPLASTCQSRGLGLVLKRSLRPLKGNDAIVCISPSDPHWLSSSLGPSHPEGLLMSTDRSLCLSICTPSIDTHRTYRFASA